MTALIRLLALIAAPLLSHIAVMSDVTELRVMAVLLLLLALCAHLLAKPVVWCGLIFTTALMIRIPMIAIGISAVFPAIFMAMAGSVFARSLLPGKTPLISAMAAAIRDEALPQKIADYCRGVTWLWAVVLFALALINLALALFASDETWSTMANIVNYVLVAMLFIGEYAVRGVWLREFGHPTTMQFLRGLRRLNYREFLQ